MPGPPPKSPSQRRRRNNVPGKTMLPIPTTTLVGKPSLAARPDGKPWHHAALAYWDAVWESPMAHEFVISDMHALLVYVDLVHEYWSIPPDSRGSLSYKTKVAAELRLQGQNFGLSPLDRRRLQWEIERAEQAVESTARRRGAASVTGADPRAAH